MKRWIIALALVALATPSLAAPVLAADRVPGDQWMRYADPAQAGFDPARLAAAKERWEALPSSAFMVVSGGAVVATWGETDRRFMCHSVRKSFLSALFGIYWDRGEVELNKTMADLGIDEADGLLETEKQARILDLLKARSGVFHPAAYAGRTDSRPRGSEGPGRYFAYNNWDFNTLAAVLEKETGHTVFEAFDEHFGRPLGMEDWRLSDGYFHYELDKSVYPAYPFRMSARDAARFGLLFAREGLWGETRILSRNWVRRSTALYSIDSDQFGYGFMWWIAREPRFEGTGFAAALGVGNQMIAALPDLDLVIVNRANTYLGEGTPMDGLLDLIEAVLQARTGEAAGDPKLLPLEPSGYRPPVTSAAPEKLAELAGEWPFPPAPLGMPERTRVSISVEDGHLVTFSPVAGTFVHYLQPDGWLVEEDSLERYLPIRDAKGAVAGIADPETISRAAFEKAIAEDRPGAAALMALLEGQEDLSTQLIRVFIADLSGAEDAEAQARRLLTSYPPRQVEPRINGAGYQLLQAGRPAAAQQVFELNTQLFPQSANAWDSLAEAHMSQSHTADAIRFYTKSLELNPENTNAEEMLKKLREE
jgi:CubicO group peptidase (beta-lactamase class C family)